jgi:hypothetical protein
MQATGRRTAGCLSISVEPRATRLEITPLPVTSRIARLLPFATLWQVPAHRIGGSGRLESCAGARLSVKARLKVSTMPSHKFHIGESVMLKPAIGRHVPGGFYEVTKQLPHNGCEYEYHIKSANEEHERVAGEGELTKA